MMDKFPITTLCTLILVLTISLVPITFEQYSFKIPPNGPLMEVFTDEKSYTKGDNIIVYGGVKSPVQGTLVTIEILDNLNNIVKVAQTYADSGSYSIPLQTNSSSWKTCGTYVVKMQYGLPQVLADTTFYFCDQVPQSNNTIISPLEQFKNGIPTNEVKCNQGLILITKTSDNSPACVKPTTAQKLVERGWGKLVNPTLQQNTSTSLPNSIKVPNTNFTVNYDIANATITGIKCLMPENCLVVSIKTSANGMLEMTIPRGLVDARVGNQDYKFHVLADGLEINFKEITKTSVDRTLSIPFKMGVNEIAIAGTELTSPLQNIQSSLPYMIKVDNSNFSLNYNITGGKLVSVGFDCHSQNIALSLNTTSSGNITVQIPRALMDAKVPINLEGEIINCVRVYAPNSQDDPFLILEQGKDITNYVETKTDIDRTLTIPFQNGTKEIDIQGTNYA